MTTRATPKAVQQALQITRLLAAPTERNTA